MRLSKRLPTERAVYARPAHFLPTAPPGTDARGGSFSDAAVPQAGGVPALGRTQSLSGKLKTSVFPKGFWAENPAFRIGSQ